MSKLEAWRRCQRLNLEPLSVAHGGDSDLPRRAHNYSHPRHIGNQSADGGHHSVSRSSNKCDAQRARTAGCVMAKCVKVLVSSYVTSPLFTHLTSTFGHIY